MILLKPKLWRHWRLFFVEGCSYYGFPILVSKWEKVESILFYWVIRAARDVIRATVCLCRTSEPRWGADCWRSIT
jgi:hypothetical protein